MTKNSQNEKTPHRPVAVPAHQKSERKSGSYMDPISKVAIFGLKVPKKGPFWVRLVRYWKSDFKFWSFGFFGNNKVVLVFGFLAKIQKRHFLAKKRLFLTFLPYFPFSIAFLWPQSSGFASNFRNLVRNVDFGRSIQGLLDTLGKTGKNQKTVLPDTFSWFDNFFHTK